MPLPLKLIVVTWVVLKVCELPPICAVKSVASANSIISVWAVFVPVIVSVFVVGLKLKNCTVNVTLAVVEAVLLLPAESCAALALTAAVTVPEPVMPVTVTV